MFKRIKKIERKKRLIFCSIILPILSFACIVPVYETAVSLPTGHFLLICLFAVFLSESYESFDDLIELNKQEKNNRISSENSEPPRIY